MTVARAVLLLVGVGCTGWGGWQIWENNPPVILLRMLTWALAAVLIHDLIFAPLCAAAGWAGRRILPARWRGPAAVAGLCTVVLLVLAIPVYGKPGLHPDNNTVLNRDYPRGLWISLALVWAAVPVYLVVARRLPVRQDQVVECQRAEDVGGQPPAA